MAVISDLVSLSLSGIVPGRLQPPISLLAATTAKNCGADANLGGSFLYRYFEIVAHSHGEHREPGTERLAHAIAILTQPAEIRANQLRLFEEGRNRQQTEQVQIWKSRNRPGQWQQLRFGNAVF